MNQQRSICRPGCLSSKFVLNRHRVQRLWGFELVVLFCSSVVGQLSSSLRWFLSSWNNFQKPKPVQCPALDDDKMKTFVLSWLRSALGSRSSCGLIFNSCFLKMIYLKLHPYVFLLSHHTRQYLVLSVFFSPSGRGGRGQGRGHEDRPRPHGLCHSK